MNVNEYWDNFSYFTSEIFACLSDMLTFLTNNPLTFTALAILALDLALSILFGVGHTEEK